MTGGYPLTGAGSLIGKWVVAGSGQRAHYVAKVRSDGTPLRGLCGGRMAALVRSVDDPMAMECRVCHGECGRRGIRLVK